MSPVQFSRETLSDEQVEVLDQLRTFTPTRCPNVPWPWFKMMKDMIARLDQGEPIGEGDWQALITVYGYGVLPIFDGALKDKQPPSTVAENLNLADFSDEKIFKAAVIGDVHVSQQEELPHITATIHIAPEQSHPYQKLFSLFKIAKGNGISFPKLNMDLGDGQKLTIYVTTAKSKYPGALALSDGKDFKSGQFYGWIGTDGTWIKQPMNCPERVKAAMHALDKDPVAFIEDVQKNGGPCVLCGKKTGVEGGMHAQCHKKWGLV